MIAKNRFKNKYILYKALAFTYVIQKKYSDALINVKNSMRYWPKDKLASDYYILFSINYFLENNVSTSIKIIKEKIKNDSVLLLSDPNDRIILANIYLNLIKNDKINMDLAKKEYEKAIAYNKYLKDAYLGLSVIKVIKSKEFDEANKLINYAYEIDKNYYLTYAMFGILTLLNNEKDKAENAIKQALKLKPNDKIVKELYDNFFK